MLIVGLGNPGKKYEGTRHNIGFEVVDRLRERFGLPDYITRFSGDFIRGTHASKPLILLKPTTFMNLSGSSVQPAASFFKIDTKQDLWVVHDDLDLGLGRIRIRHSNGAGGHNGVKSIMDRVGHHNFMRFRIGIGRPETPQPIEDFVLEKFSKEEREIIDIAIDRMADALTFALTDGIDAAMNRYSS